MKQRVRASSSAGALIGWERKDTMLSWLRAEWKGEQRVQQPDSRGVRAGAHEPRVKVHSAQMVQQNECNVWRAPDAGLQLNVALLGQFVNMLR